MVEEVEYMLLKTFIQLYLRGAIIGGLIWGAIFAFACYKIVKNKGYPEDSCVGNAIGGFCLSWIWMIVVLCKPNASAEMREESNGRAESTVSIGVSQPVFIAVLLTALAVSAAGVFVLVKFSWWGLAIVGVGLVIFAILHNKA